MTASPSSSATHLPLHAWHLAHGARMGVFGGWNMPVQYTAGILAEHRHTRTGAGLFDISHMGQITLRSRSPDASDVPRALEAIIPADLGDLAPGRQRYGFFTTPTGGISDDLMVTNRGDCWTLVVNAAATRADLEHLQTHVSPWCTIDSQVGHGMLALQGPTACAVLCTWIPQVASLCFLGSGVFSFEGVECVISRSGYTGEDGFELSIPVAALEHVAERLCGHPSVRLAGLGARDSLRLEAGLCLCGQDIGEDTSPVEAGLAWAIPHTRRYGGARGGGFIGAEVILAQLAAGATRRRVGLRSQTRPVRAGCELFTNAGSTQPLGKVTSGTFGPTVDAPVAMGYLPIALANIGTRLMADIRGERIPVTVSALPFVPHRYHH